MLNTDSTSLLSERTPPVKALTKMKVQSSFIGSLRSKLPLEFNEFISSLVGFDGFDGFDTQAALRKHRLFQNNHPPYCVESTRLQPVEVNAACYLFATVIPTVPVGGFVFSDVVACSLLT